MQEAIIGKKPEENTPLYVESVEKLASAFDYIGFLHKDGDKYFVLNCDTGIYALRPVGYFSNIIINEGQFFIFNTNNELLEWMRDS